MMKCYQRRKESPHKVWNIGLVNLPKGKEVVGCKWVDTIRHGVSGSSEHDKARLVAKRFT